MLLHHPCRHTWRSRAVKTARGKMRRHNRNNFRARHPFEHDAWPSDIFGLERIRPWSDTSSSSSSSSISNGTGQVVVCTHACSDAVQDGSMDTTPATVCSRANSHGKLRARLSICECIIAIDISVLKFDEMRDNGLARSQYVGESHQRESPCAPHRIQVYNKCPLFLECVANPPKNCIRQHRQLRPGAAAR